MAELQEQVGSVEWSANYTSRELAKVRQSRELTYGVEQQIIDVRLEMRTLEERVSTLEDFLVKKFGPFGGIVLVEPPPEGIRVLRIASPRPTDKQDDTEADNAAAGEG